MIIQKLSDTEDILLHWLEDTVTGEVSRKADYTQFTYLNGYVGYTAYYGTKEGVATADEFCKMVAGAVETVYDYVNSPHINVFNADKGDEQIKNVRSVNLTKRQMQQDDVNLITKTWSFREARVVRDQNNKVASIYLTGLAVVI